MASSNTMPVQAEPPALLRRRQAMQALLHDASIEVSPRERHIAESCRELLPPGTTIYISFASGDTYQAIVAAAAALRRAGFNPVPHIAARRIIGYTQLDDYLARIAGEAAVTQVLVIAGDLEQPAGPYPSSRDIIAAGLLERHGIRQVGVAGYPEGHPRIATPVLAAALAEKLALLGRAGLSPYVVTQFSFEPAPILRWIDALRERGTDVPVRIGLAGPASVATLAKFAIRCGIGNSIRALVGRKTAVARLVTESHGPEPIIAALTQADPGARGIAGLHFFTFGEIGRTARWLGAAMGGAVDPTTGAVGFYP